MASRMAIANSIAYAKCYSRSHECVIRVYDEAGNVIETHEHAGEFKESLIRMSHATGANPKRAGVKVVNVLTVVDLRRGQRPADGKRGAVSASKALKIVQIPNRGLTCARIEQDEIRLAIVVKIRRAVQRPSGGQSRTVGAADKHVVV